VNSDPRGKYFKVEILVRCSLINSFGAFKVRVKELLILVKQEVSHRVIDIISFCGLNRVIKREKVPVKFLYHIIVSGYIKLIDLSGFNLVEFD
jgi:hypothetical protein